MRSPALVILALVVCSQFAPGYTNQDVTGNDNKLSSSRAERAAHKSKDMGTPSLRLGKREAASLDFSEDDHASTYDRSKRSLNVADEADLLKLELQNKVRLERSVTQDMGDLGDRDVIWQYPHRFSNNYGAHRDGYGHLDDELSASDLHNIIEFDKRQLPMLRLGKRESDDKRNLHMLRLGKRDFEEDQDGRLSMLRASKRQLPMLRLGKRSMDRSVLGDSLRDDDNDEEKRAISMLRLGKRQLMMLRLGKRQQDDTGSTILLERDNHWAK